MDAPSAPVVRESNAGAADLGALARLLRGRSVVVLTGAGISTDSGIPDYRGPASAGRVRSPIQFRDFLNDPAARTRYWARATVGWQNVQRARPNASHVVLARLERAGIVRGILTQNVDGLHSAAGSRNVIELHGRLSLVRCLDCRAAESRASMQTRILELNPDFARHGAEIAPDGDAELDAALVARYRVPACRACGGALKPDVVFFGENVPRERVERAYALLDAGHALLVLGSSLTVFSGYRFVRRAAERRTPVAIVNLGPTRGDPHADLRLDAPLAPTLAALEALLVP